jgi:hypothetical protein
LETTDKRSSGALSLSDGRVRYGLETCFDMVRGFLMNAQTWKGEAARRIKLELPEMLKDAQ